MLTIESGDYILMNIASFVMSIQCMSMVSVNTRNFHSLVAANLLPGVTMISVRKTGK